ncbi:MAG: potassium transporter TrkA [Deltaproteobacteria bacterium HGW-Deltaproteobacteria-20]|jgi:trk system potassium uptake protein TrkA|nr:MAG: potassium transporter TrkA [Deltaproteobacteria bacterium HGW-Deltaproteobacteria-20]
MAGKSHRRVVVVGCGRLGAHLASRLSVRGVDVVVVDLNEAAFQSLSPEFGGFRFAGDATELAVLRKARVEEADTIIVTTRDDNTNMMVAQVAKQVLGVPQALARVFDPSREAIYHGLEIETVCPTMLAADAAVEILSAQSPKETA